MDRSSITFSFDSDFGNLILDGTMGLNSVGKADRVIVLYEVMPIAKPMDRDLGFWTSLASFRGRTRRFIVYELDQYL